MKTRFFFLGLLCLFILTACPSSEYQPSLKKIRDNKMDFPQLEKRYYHGIHFKLSKLFRADFNPKYVIKNKAFTRRIDDLSVYFSIEAFSDKEAAKYQFGYTDQIDKLNAIQDFYILKRENSLSEPITSIKKNTPKKVGFKGVIQTVEGSIYEDGITSNYLTATLKIDKKYYVFQLISNNENMGYLYDDFIDILISVEK